MKKVLFAVMMLMSTAAQVFAGEFFSKVVKVAELGGYYYAYTESDDSVRISPLRYMEIRDYDGYYVISTGDTTLVVAGDEFFVERLVVDRVMVENDKPKVFFTNGTAKVFNKKDWFAVQAGQAVRRAYVKTRKDEEYENFATEYGRKVVYHSKVAPTKKATAPTTPTAQQPTAPSAPTQTAQQPAQGISNNGGITFRVTKK